MSGDKTNPCDLKSFTNQGSIIEGKNKFWIWRIVTPTKINTLKFVKSISLI